MLAREYRTIETGLGFVQLGVSGSSALGSHKPVSALNRFHGTAHGTAACGLSAFKCRAYGPPQVQDRRWDFRSHRIRKLRSQLAEVPMGGFALDDDDSFHDAEETADAEAEKAN